MGILKQSQQATYLQAHEQSTQALLEALAPTNVGHLTYLSIVGSSADASNLCLASKGRAEELCVQNQLPTCILRVPMVLGEGDYASFALKSRALQRISFNFRGWQHRAADLRWRCCEGYFHSSDFQQVEGALDLAGAEKVTRRELTSLAGAHTWHPPEHRFFTHFDRFNDGQSDGTPVEESAGNPRDVGGA